MAQAAIIHVKKEEDDDGIVKDFLSDGWGNWATPEGKSPEPMNMSRQPDKAKKEESPQKEEDVEIAAAYPVLHTPPGDQKRWFLDAVVVPTFRQVCRDRARLAEDNSQALRNGGAATVKREVSPLVKIESTNSSAPLTVEAESDKLAVPLKKRKVKIKLEDLEFDDDISKRRYKAHGISPFPVPINVGRDVYEVMVPRFFMSSVYGGNFVEVMPAISEEKFREHGFRNFFYAALDAHPQAPRIPGAPGLWFSAGDVPDRESEPEPEILRVFTRVVTKPKALWQYQGQYQLRASESITKEEWARQAPEVRNTWISYLETVSWATETRAAIYGRKTFGRKATFDEILTILEQGLDKNVTKEEIALAFTRGEQRLLVYTLKCVGYDVDFQHDLIQRFRKWNPKAAKEKKNLTKKRPSKKADPNPAKKKRPRTGRHKDSEIGSDSEASVMVLDDDDDDNAEQVESPYIPRGTQSRPNRRK
ncbi:hypothetical protein MD484_g8160, partial [Candolleomyces efflorescens]